MKWETKQIGHQFIAGVLCLVAGLACDPLLWAVLTDRFTGVTGYVFMWLVVAAIHCRSWGSQQWVEASRTPPRRQRRI